MTRDRYINKRRFTYVYGQIYNVLNIVKFRFSEKTESTQSKPWMKSLIILRQKRENFRLVVIMAFILARIFLIILHCHYGLMLFTKFEFKKLLIFLKREIISYIILLNDVETL